MEELRQLCTLITVVAAAGGVLWKPVKATIARSRAREEGIRCLLRTEMLRTYYRHKDDGKIRQYEMENFEHNFSAYTALGGNSFIGNLHEEVVTWEVES